MIRVALVLLVAAGAACSISVGVGNRAAAVAPFTPATPAHCPDGDAPRVVSDLTCPGGICGYSCLPGRWAPPAEVR